MSERRCRSVNWSKRTVLAVKILSWRYEIPCASVMILAYLVPRECVIPIGMSSMLRLAQALAPALEPAKQSKQRSYWQFEDFISYKILTSYVKFGLQAVFRAGKFVRILSIQCFHRVYQKDFTTANGTPSE